MVSPTGLTITLAEIKAKKVKLTPEEPANPEAASRVTTAIQLDRATRYGGPSNVVRGVWTDHTLSDPDKSRQLAQEISAIDQKMQQYQAEAETLLNRLAPSGVVSSDTVDLGNLRVLGAYLAEHPASHGTIGYLIFKGITSQNRSNVSKDHDKAKKLKKQVQNE